MHCGSLEMGNAHQQLNYHFGGRNYVDFITLLLENKYSVNHCKSWISSKVPLTYQCMCHIHLEGIGNEGALLLSPLQSYKLWDFLPLELAVALWFLFWVWVLGFFFFSLRLVQIFLSLTETSAGVQRDTHSSCARLWDRFITVGMPCKRWLQSLPEQSLTFMKLLWITESRGVSRYLFWTSGWHLQGKALSLPSRRNSPLEKALARLQQTQLAADAPMAAAFKRGGDKRQEF